MEKKRAYRVLLVGLVLCAFSVFWEQSSEKENEQRWLTRFQQQLHHMEQIARRELDAISNDAHSETQSHGDDLILVTFKNSKLVTWTDKAIGDPHLYAKLHSPRNIQKINGTYYEVLRRVVPPYEYFALIKIKDDKLYNNDHIRNRFGTFFKIGDENTDMIQISPNVITEGHVIYSDRGVPLFYIKHKAHYIDKSINYIALTFYIFFFLSLFYVYSQLQKSAPNGKYQLLYFIVFLLILFILRCMIDKYRVPMSIYQMDIFTRRFSDKMMLSSIGDLFITTFSICQIFYITLKYLKLDFKSPKIYYYRWIIVAAFVLLAYLYTTLFSFIIESVIAYSDVCLNIARIVNIDFISVVAFTATLLGGLGLIVIIDSAVTLFIDFIPIRYLLTKVSLFMFILTGTSFLLNPILNLWECLFLWGIYLLIIFNKYLVKKEIQRSIYMLLMFSLSVYVVVIAKQQEQYKELTLRAEYATRLIEEKDANFESELKLFDFVIKNDVRLNTFLFNYDEALFKNYLKENIFNVVGYNYDVTITTCYPNEQLFVKPSQQLYDCKDYFIQLLERYGKRIDKTNFYLIDRFDGKITYLGVFLFEGVHCYIEFNSLEQKESSGYEQLLSRESKSKLDDFYEYSYGKYHNGRLIASEGSFKYYKDLRFFGKLSEDIHILSRADYSHMIIPLKGNNTIVISIHESHFKVYYLNILYAFFLTMLISSYGLIFGTRLTTKRRTFKRRIKNRIITLVLILFIILTALSIYINKRTFEERQNYRSAEFLEFVQKQLAQLDCVDVRICPEVLNVLNQLSGLLKVDINIYTIHGELVATSEENLFKYGFDGYLINPKALKHIIDRGEMSYVTTEQIGDMEYMSAYMPFELENGKMYIINIPYFAQNNDLNREIIIMVIIAVNIALVMMMIAFILSGFVADRITRPLEMLNVNLKKMRVGGQNEKIVYKQRDEIGLLVKEYNNMVDKVDESIQRLAKSERESAWREMARQIAHEIKNPLTPMKLNIQLLQRSSATENCDRFKERFTLLSNVLIEQIDNMASIASAFSDFARIQQPNNEWFDLSELAVNCVALFEGNVDYIESMIEPDIRLFADKKQMQRVLVNLLKNAEQSIPEEHESRLQLELFHKASTITIKIKDNGVGIPDELRGKIFEPNFTTKSSGTGLGLAISSSIIQGFGGTITFNSVLNEGTEFIITLPYTNNRREEIEI